MFFDSWMGLARVLVVGVCAYGALVLFLRISGKRTLAKLNAFDLVVTVALGSTLASIIVTKSVALLEGLLAFALLISLQFGIAWLSVRSERLRRLVSSEPSLLMYKGEMLPRAMRTDRITEDEVLAAIRAAGIGDPAKVEAVVLETDGSISVVSEAVPAGARSSLAGVRQG